MDQSAKFWDRLAERYSKQPVADEAAYQKKLQVTRNYLRPNMEVLEFGCGTGSTAIAHAPFVKQMHGIDLSEKMVEIAQRKADAEHITNITFTRSSIDQFSPPDHALDAVLGLSVLHLLDDWEEVVAKVHKMLKPGGVFISSTACIGDSMKLLKVVLPIGRFLGLIPLVKVFTTRELEQALANSGFKIDYQWQPGKNKAVFIVATKAE